MTTKSFKQTDELRQWCKLTLVSVFTHCFCRELRGSGRALGLPTGIAKLRRVEARVAPASRYGRSVDHRQDDSMDSSSIQLRRVDEDPSVSVEQTSHAGDPKPIRRKRLSSKSQTYEAKIDSCITTLEPAGPNPGDGYTLRRMLISARLK